MFEVRKDYVCVLILQLPDPYSTCSEVSMGRRANHEGSIRQRKDGSWEAKVRIEGKRRSLYGKSRAEAVRKLREYTATFPVGWYGPATKVRLSEWVERWVGESELRPSTLQTYRSVMRRITNEIGHVRLHMLTPVLLARVFTKLAEQGMGARRRHHAYVYLRSCLGRAVELEIIARNPMLKVRRPRWEPTPRDHWTLEQAQAFVAACLRSERRYAPLFLLAVTCGLRFSEVVGLRAEDVGRGTVTVRRALVWVKDRYHEGAPKTRSSWRKISVPAMASGALARVPFLTATGAAPVPSQLRLVLAALCKEAGVPLPTVQELRHVAAALAYRATGDVYAVQARMGHSRASTTLNVYGYGMGAEDETGAAIDWLLSGQSSS